MQEVAPSRRVMVTASFNTPLLSLYCSGNALLLELGYRGNSNASSPTSSSTHINSTTNSRTNTTSTTRVGSPAQEVPRGRCGAGWPLLEYKATPSPDTDRQTN